MNIRYAKLKEIEQVITEIVGEPVIEDIEINCGSVCIHIKLLSTDALRKISAYIREEFPAPYIIYLSHDLAHILIFEGVGI
jgi:hypothetical protein